MALEREEVLRAFEPPSCAKFQEVYDQLLRSKEYLDLEEENRDMMEEMERIAGYDKGHVQLYDISCVTDPLTCERDHEMDWIPEFQANPEYFDKGVKLFDWVTAQVNLHFF